MTKLILPVVAFSALMLSSCGNDSDVQNAVQAETATRSFDVNGTKVLEFANQSDFDSAVTQLSLLENSAKKSEWMHVHYPMFRSIKDVYEDAMVEADEIGDSESDFDTFMDKYSSLYFPLYKEDAGFYVPIKDENVAYFANANCEVRIAGKTITLRDINDYQTLMDLGVAYYTNPKPKRLMVAENNDVITFKIDRGLMVNSVEGAAGKEYDSGWQQYDKRKVKLKARRRIFSTSTHPYLSALHTEFCFRKKKPRGWVNYSSYSKITGSYQAYGSNKAFPINFEQEQRSSHDHDDPNAIFYDESVGKYVLTRLICKYSIQYRGVASELHYEFMLPKAVSVVARYEPLMYPCYISPKQ